MSKKEKQRRKRRTPKNAFNLHLAAIIKNKLWGISDVVLCIASYFMCKKINLKKIIATNSNNNSSLLRRKHHLRNPGKVVQLRLQTAVTNKIRLLPCSQCAWVWIHNRCNMCSLWINTAVVWQGLCVTLNQFMWLVKAHRSQAGH